MLTGNKFKNYNLYTPQLPGEVNYTDWNAKEPSGGSSYAVSALGNNDYYKKMTRYTPDMPGQIDQYAGMPNLPENNPYKTIDNYKLRLENTPGNVGVPEREGKGLGNVLMTVLDVMQRPQYMVTNALDDLTDNKDDSFGDVLKDMGKGLTGEKKSSTTDVFDNLGWQNDYSKKWYQGGNLARNVLGFAGDVLLDPTTYLTAGTASLAKGMGKAGTKAMAEDVLSKVGGDAMSKSMPDISKRLAEALGGGKTAADVSQMAAKHGKQGDFVQRLAYALGDMANEGSSNRQVIEHVLDKGVGGVNRDYLNDIKSPLEEQLKGMTAKGGELPSAIASINRTIGANFNTKSKLKSIGIDLSKISQSDRFGFIQTLNKAMDVPSTMVSDADKTSLLKNIYDSVGEVYDTLPDVTNKEYDVLNTLYNAFGTTAKIPDVQSFIDVSKKIAGDTKPDVFKKLNEKFDDVERLNVKMKKIENGVEFANGFQRVMDKADKAFYIKYHNPFTNNIVPLADISHLAATEKARQAWQAVVEMNPLSPVTNKIANIVGKTFDPRYVDKTISKMDDGTSDTKRYEAAKWTARYVTDYIRMETGLPKSALESVRIFQSIPGFLENEKLMHALSFYTERNNSRLAQTAWAWMSGEEITDDLADTMALLEQSGRLADLAAYKLTPNEIETLKKAGGQVYLYNEALAKTDASIGLKFDPNKEDEAENYLASISKDGGLDKQHLESYIRHYTDYSAAEKFPTSSGKAMPKFTSDEINGDLKRGMSTRDELSKATSETTGAYQKRRFKSLVDQMVYDPSSKVVTNAVEAMARRHMETSRVALNKQFVDGILKAMNEIPGFETLVSRKKFDGAEMVDLADGTEAFYAHPEIARQLNKVRDMFSRTESVESELKEVFMSISNGLKRLQTTYNPSFNIRNLTGEPLMNWFAGVTAKSNKTAWDILHEAQNEDLVRVGNTTFKLGQDETTPLYRSFEGEFGNTRKQKILEYGIQNGGKGVQITGDAANIERHKGKLREAVGSNAKTYVLGGRTYTSKELIKLMNDGGLGWSGITKGNISKNMRDTLDKEVLSKSQHGLKRVNNAVENFGDTIETWTRLAHLIDSLDKGMDIQSALLEVRKYHVDYRDLTPTERNLFRNIAPYYTYMRKNLPIQVKMLLERQNRVNIIGQLVDSSYEAVQRDNGDKEFSVPDYLKEGLAIPLNVDDKGNVSYLNWGIPLSDVGRLKYNMNELFMENIFSMWSPFIKAPLESSMNQNMMYGTNIEKFKGEKQPMFPQVEGGAPVLPTWADTGLQQLGVVNSVRNAIGTGLNYAQTGMGKTQAAGNAGLSEQLMTTLFNAAPLMGLNGVMPTKNSDDVRNQQAYDYRDQLYAYIKRLEQEGQPVTPYTPTMRSLPKYGL